MQEISVFRPMMNAFGPSIIKVRTASRREPKNNLRKLVYDAEEPCSSMSFTNSPIVPQRHPVINILVKLLNSEFIASMPFLFRFQDPRSVVWMLYNSIGFIGQRKPLKVLPNKYSTEMGP